MDVFVRPNQGAIISLEHGETSAPHKISNQSVSSICPPTSSHDTTEERSANLATYVQTFSDSRNDDPSSFFDDNFIGRLQYPLPTTSTFSQLPANRKSWDEYFVGKASTVEVFLVFSVRLE